MHTVEAHASAKLIIAGEHAVVYLRPALAVPLPDIRVTVHITAGQPQTGCQLHMPDIQRSARLGVDSDPLLDLLSDMLQAWDLQPPDMIITVQSDIPIASGMGSGAAVATALVRACAAWFAQTLTPATVAALVFRSEQRLHGTPSGIDNTVIAYDQPISFCRRGALADGTAQTPLIHPLRIGAPITVVIADTGVRSPTHLAVSGVRTRRSANPAHYDALFDAIGAVTLLAQDALARGDAALLGMAARQNQSLLAAIGVSTPLLDALCHAADHAGAYGTKLSGAGVGGIVMAVVDPSTQGSVAAALRTAGARTVMTTTIAAYPPQ
jgi:mevalonate kinase